MTLEPERLTRDQQREAARAKARELREQQKKSDKRKRLMLQLGVVFGVLLVIGGVVATILVGAQRAANSNLEPKNLSFNGGLKMGVGQALFTADSTPTASPSADAAAPINIQMYIDYQCPVCQAFEIPNENQLRSWMDSGVATLEVHPISFLDGRGSPNEYSSRAANAAICVAEYSPQSFWLFHTSLMKNQPQELTPGPSNQELFDTAKTMGITNADKIESCIKDKAFGSWVKKTTDTVLSPEYMVEGADFGVDGTPTVVVNGQKYEWETGEDLVNPARFAQWVQQAGAQK
jgi:protein-disulfide isomerase